MKVSFFLIYEINRAPVAPIPAASVGVAKPNKIEPSTEKIKKSGAKRELTICFIL